MSAKGKGFPALDKKVPRNPKFEGVKSKTDTGASVSKKQEREAYRASRFRKRKNEEFRRIKVSTFAQLVLEVIDNEEDALADMLDEAATFGKTPAEVAEMRAAEAAGLTQVCDDGSSMQTANTSASSFYNLVHGTGERRQRAEPVGTGAAAAAISQQSVSPYVLLDLRDSDDYDRCHINGAINFPVARLNRSTNTYTPAILAFLNQPGKIVIVYDEDEKIACDAATTMCRRGGENVFLLSGGLRVLAEKFPGGEFITGPLPAHLRPGRSSSRSSPRQTSTSSLASTGGSSGSTAGQAAAVVRPGGGFTREEVERIRMQLEENLLADDASSMASTMRSTRKSTTGSVAGSRTGSRTGSRAGSRAGARTSSSSSEAKAWR